MATRDERRKVKERAGAQPSCVRVVVHTYRDGGVRPSVVPCERWTCPMCAERKVEDLMDRLKLSSGGGDLFALEVPRDKWDPVRKMAMRHGAGYVGFKRHSGSILFVCDAQLKGRDWKLRPTTTTQVKADVLRHGVKRVDWCKEWRPEPRKRGQTVGRVSLPAGWAREVLERAGYDGTTGRIAGLDAFQTVERLAAVAEEVAAEKSLVRGSEQARKVPSPRNARGKRRRRRESP